MKTRLRIAMLYIKAGLILIFLVPISGIWWIITGNDFVNKIVNSIFTKIRSLEAMLNKDSLKTRTDTERLDALQKLTTGYGDGWILRPSKSDRGMRLHETSSNCQAKPNIRDAIDQYLDMLNEQFNKLAYGK